MFLYEDVAGLPEELLRQARPALIIAGGIIVSVYLLWLADIITRLHKARK